VAVDISAASLEQARARIAAAGYRNVEFQVANLFDLPFSEGALRSCLPLLRSGARGGASRRAASRAAGPAPRPDQSRRSRATTGPGIVIRKRPRPARAVQCLVDVQARFGGDALIGRRLYPLLTEAGFRDVRVSPRMVYVDSSRPELVEGFSRNTFIAMVEGVRDRALSLGNDG